MSATGIATLKQPRAKPIKASATKAGSVSAALSVR